MKELLGDGRASEQLTLAQIRNLHSLQLSCDQQQFVFFVNYGYAHISLLCFPLVMLSASHWLLAQSRFCGRTHLPLSPNSTTSTGQVIFWYLRPDEPVFNTHRIHSTCGHGDISAITLLILSLSGCSCLNILWYIAPVNMMTFRWSRLSYQSICQQHPPYLHLQVTLTYYIRSAIIYLYLDVVAIEKRAFQSPSTYFTRKKNKTWPDWNFQNN